LSSDGDGDILAGRNCGQVNEDSTSANPAYAITDRYTQRRLSGVRPQGGAVSEWHPDKLDTMAQELRDYATRRTARINEAYERLRSARV